MSQCQLPVDRVRGLLRLAQDAHEVGIAAEEWSDVVVVYTKFSRYLLGSAERYKIVPSHEWWRWMSIALTLVRRADLPSWVPDFHQQDLALNYDFRYGQMWYTNFSGIHGSVQNGASAKENKGAVPGNRWNELILKGKMVDEVLTVYPEIPRPLPEASIHQKIHRLCCVAHWEVELANAVSSGRVPDDHRAHRPVPLDTYWLTLRGGSLHHLPDGGLTLESYQRYHETAIRMNEVAQKYGIIDRYAELPYCPDVNGDNILMQPAAFSKISHYQILDSQRRRWRSSRMAITSTTRGGSSAEEWPCSNLDSCL